MQLPDYIVFRRLKDNSSWGVPQLSLYRLGMQVRDLAEMFAAASKSISAPYHVCSILCHLGMGDAQELLRILMKDVSYNLLVS